MPAIRASLCIVFLITLAAAPRPPRVVAQEAVEVFHSAIEPILQEHCLDCHSGSDGEGNVSFDEFDSEQAMLADKRLWQKVLANVRAGLMPPREDDDTPIAINHDQRQQLADWIKFGVFKIDPRNPSPGGLVVRRLNRVEYRNTIRDLFGIDFRADAEFPPDDTGNGFDNNGDVLSISPLLIEKYLSAAESIVEKGLPNDFPDKKEGHSDVQLKNHSRYFTKNATPSDQVGRDEYAAEIFGAFLKQAFRKPANQATVQRLVGLARSQYEKPALTFEQGISRGMMAALASPQFLFRIEAPESDRSETNAPLVSEHALASRLSYFLWSTMPDETLFRLADQHKLRENLPEQINRMIQDEKVFDGLVKSFAGQWLQIRDIDAVEINGKAILGKGPVDGNRRTKYDFDNKMRRAMRKETELYVEFVLRENRELVELIDSDYTFLNEKLAQQYDIKGVKGDDHRLVRLPRESPRGGVLTQGTILAVTSNPTRTSPVKRGIFVLENFLGTPPPPAPPNVPELDATEGKQDGKDLTLRQRLAVHRESAVCSSCHNRMDPLGLAFENFIPMGNWRQTEAGQPVNASGRLITGESFETVQELKQILVHQRRQDFYRCISEKMLSYAIGRSLDHRDTHTIDLIVKRLVDGGGKSHILINEIIASAPFQKYGKHP